MNTTDYRTIITFLPTANKAATWAELRNTVRHLAGTVYEDKDANESIMNNDPDTPSNCIAYDRQLGEEEKKAIIASCKDKGVLVLFIEGTENSFDSIDSDTNSIILKESKED